MNHDTHVLSPNSAFFTSPLWGEVGEARSAKPGEGAYPSLEP
jgi:hypothetical protein